MTLITALRNKRFLAMKQTLARTLFCILFLFTALCVEAREREYTQVLLSNGTVLTPLDPLSALPSGPYYPEHRTSP